MIEGLKIYFKKSMKKNLKKNLKKEALLTNID